MRKIVLSGLILCCFVSSLIAEGAEEAVGQETRDRNLVRKQKENADSILRKRLVPDCTESDVSAIRCIYKEYRKLHPNSPVWAALAIEKPLSEEEIASLRKKYIPVPKVSHETALNKSTGSGPRKGKDRGALLTEDQLAAIRKRYLPRERVSSASASIITRNNSAVGGSVTNKETS